MEPVPEGSKTDSPLAKDGFISNTGGTSVTIYLRKTKNYCSGAVRRKNEKKCERNN